MTGAELAAIFWLAVLGGAAAAEAVEWWRSRGRAS